VGRHLQLRHHLPGEGRFADLPRAGQHLQKASLFGQAARQDIMEILADHTIYSGH